MHADIYNCRSDECGRFYMSLHRFSKMIPSSFGEGNNDARSIQLYLCDDAVRDHVSIYISTRENLQEVYVLVP